MLSIEVDPPKQTVCPCCGGTTTNLVGFVYRDGDAYAIYYAAFARNHPERALQALVGLGDWSEGVGPERRVAFALRIWSASDQYNVEVLDAPNSMWKDTQLLGRLLTRTEALDHEWKDEVFHIADHMATDDREVRWFLEGSCDGA